MEFLIGLIIGLVVGFGTGMGVYYYNRESFSKEAGMWKDSYENIKKELEKYK